MTNTANLPTSQHLPATAGRAKAGKHLTFTLGRESYGLEVLKVREIIRMQDITPVPQMPDYVKGVINLRGKVVPVIDLRLKFRLAKAEFTERTCIIVVQVSLASGTSSLMGLIVDAVEEVVNIIAQEIEGPPDFGAKLSAEYLLGMAKLKNGVKTLLDIDRVVTAETIECLRQTPAADQS
ncbi:MAG: purine-binding chemotaxis protein CheW [Verrucomicrobia bacterium]|nr:purine-binding chemotaxis protein CheW [Verrucomicrobiota bacterium]